MIELPVLIGWIVFGLIPIVSAVAIALIARSIYNRVPTSPIVEYVPPAGDIFDHGLLMRADRRLVAAAIVGMAVRGAVRVLAPQGKRGPVALQRITAAPISEREAMLLQTFRPTTMTDDQQVHFLRAVREVSITADSVDEARDIYFIKGRGAFRVHQRRALTVFFETRREELKAVELAKRWSASAHVILLSLLFLVSAVGGGFLLVGALTEGQWVGAILVVLTVAALFWVLTISPPPFLRFTPRGQELRRHLVGLRGYIRLAEQDRLRVLQSPQGALRTAAGGLTPAGIALGLTATTSASDVVAQSALDRFILNERLLPYAILFRQEEGWQRQFDHITDLADVSQNMRVLGATADTLSGLVDAISIIFYVFRGLAVITWVLPG